jgi:anaerobic selenocysteine-containing dehydrogenase
MKTITVCNLDCPDSCSLVVETREDGTVVIGGNPNHPVTRGFVCAKMKKYPERLVSSERIVRPLLRAGSSWKPIAWDTALDLCAERIQHYRHDPASILHLPGEGAKGVLKLAGNLFFGRLGTSHAVGSLCDTAGITANIADFGSLDTNDVRDIVNARVIVNWGKDLSRSSIHTAELVRQARKNGAEVITISPGGDGNRPFSDHFIRIRPGTDRFLAAAVMRIFMERNAVREDIPARTQNWARFRQVVRETNLEDLAAECQVPEEEVERLYHVYNRREPVATLIGWGLQRYVHGGENVRFINALALIAGHIGRAGGGSYFSVLSLRNFNCDWASEATVPDRRTLSLPTIGRSILEARDPAVKMIWVHGCNVVNQAPESKLIRTAFRTSEFNVVVDAFMTDTAELAHVILPCTLTLEQQDIVGSALHNYIHYAEKTVEPPGEAWDDFRILSELGKRLNPPLFMPEPEACLRASLHSPYLGTTLEELKEKKFVKAARPYLAYEGMNFDHPDGRYRFPDVLHPETPPPPEYPGHLLSLIRRDAIHSQIAGYTERHLPKVWVAVDSNVIRNIDLEKDVYLASPLGRLKVRVEKMDGVHPDVIIYRRGDWLKHGGGVNQLIEAGVTDMGQGTSYYSQCVRLEN